jgi:hypothetical protein
MDDKSGQQILPRSMRAWRKSRRERQGQFIEVCTVGDRKVILRDDLVDFLRSNPSLPR